MSASAKTILSCFALAGSLVACVKTRPSDLATELQMPSGRPNSTPPTSTAADLSTELQNDLARRGVALRDALNRRSGIPENLTVQEVRFANAAIVVSSEIGFTSRPYLVVDTVIVLKDGSSVTIEGANVTTNSPVVEEQGPNAKPLVRTVQGANSAFTEPETGRMIARLTTQLENRALIDLATEAAGGVRTSSFFDAFPEMGLEARLAEIARTSPYTANLTNEIITRRLVRASAERGGPLNATALDGVRAEVISELRTASVHHWSLALDRTALTRLTELLERRGR